MRAEWYDMEQVRRLLAVYNARVDAVETDKSLLIELPPNLALVAN